MLLEWIIFLMLTNLSDIFSENSTQQGQDFALGKTSDFCKEEYPHFFTIVSNSTYYRKEL